MLKIFPPVWYFIFLSVSLALHFFVPDSRVFHLTGIVYKIIGVVLFAFGMYLSMKASKQFAENKTEILPTSPTNSVLVTDGAFRYTRNPMYAGMVASLLGVAVYVGTLPTFLAAVAQFLVLNTFFVPFEEAKLVRIFGEQYDQYRKSVRRWI